MHWLDKIGPRTITMTPLDVVSSFTWSTFERAQCFQRYKRFRNGAIWWREFDCDERYRRRRRSMRSLRMSTDSATYKSNMPVYTYARCGARVNDNNLQPPRHTQRVSHGTCLEFNMCVSHIETCLRCWGAGARLHSQNV